MFPIQAMRPYDVMDIVESYSAGQIFKQQIQNIDAFLVSQDQNYTITINMQLTLNPFKTKS